jgi:host factor-I protein
MTDNNTTDTSVSDNAEVDVKSYKSLEQAFSLGNGQNTALNWLKETNQVVSVFLVSGIKLEGVISGHDQYSMTLTDDHGCQQLIYKAKISTITIANTSEKPQHKPGYKQFHRQPRNNYQQNQQ